MLVNCGKKEIYDRSNCKKQIIYSFAGLNQESWLCLIVGYS